jgi:ABC-type transport system involved in multi-copper enzyme maturation permease subunit
VKERSGNGILVVAGWELRRLGASAGNYGLVVGVFVLFVGLVWVKHSWAIPVESGSGRGVVLNVIGSTALGTVFEVVALLLLFFGVLVPFVVADGVARDHRQRIHELLMAAPISNASYVLGRFVASLGVAIVLSIVMLAAIAVADLTISLSEPGFVALNWAGLFLTWAVLVLPAVVVIGGISFMLSTLVPRIATPAKVTVVLGWVLLSVVVDVGHGLGWFGYWTPTGNGVLKVLPPDAAERYASLLHAGAGNASSLSLQVQQQLPDLWPWVGPHLGLVVIGFACAAIAALRFRRFQNSLGGA